MDIKEFFKTTNKSVLYWLVFGVAVLIAGGAAWRSWNQTFSNLCGPEPPVICGVNMRLTCINGKWDCREIEEKIDISNWKTYRNEKYGFKFEYPPDYSIRTENKNIFIEKQGGGLYAVVIMNNLSKLTASEYFEKFKSDNKRQCEVGPCASILSDRAVQINNLLGVEAELAGEGSSDARNIYFSVGSNIINYQYSRDNLNTEFGGKQTLYDTYILNGEKILSTFRFIE